MCNKHAHYVRYIIYSNAFSQHKQIETVQGINYCISRYFREGFISRFSRTRPSRKFPLQFMSIYSNDNISKIAKLTPRELPHLVQNRENNCTQK